MFLRVFAGSELWQWQQSVPRIYVGMAGAALLQIHGWLSRRLTDQWRLEIHVGSTEYK